jgi:hypothetical protein
MKRARSRTLACAISFLIVLIFSLPDSGVLPATNQQADPVYLPQVQQISGGSIEPAPTSIELIDKDLKTGLIDAYTAAIYKAYTIIPDSPLPAKYKGAPDPHADIAIFQDLLEQYDLLTPTQKAEADPYLRRPDDPTSALFQYQQRQPAAQQPARRSASQFMATATRPQEDIQWTSILTVTGVKIHYRKDISGDAILAEELKAEIDRKIHTFLNDLMGRVWMDDTNCNAGGKIDNGGSGALDIYLMHGIPERGIEMACKKPPSPAWVVLNADEPIGDEINAGMVQTAAHEMFHAIQDSYSYKMSRYSYYWMLEATATWVEDYVYHDAQSEREFAQNYLIKTWEPMDEEPWAGNKQYGEYLWPFYLYRVQNKPASFIKNMFEQAANYRSEEVFMQRAGSDEPVLLFPDFALKNWNQAPFDDYQAVDSLAEQALITVKKYVQGITTKDKYLIEPFGEDTINHLTATYYDFVFSDATARTVAFYNGLSHKLSEGTGNINFLDTASIFYQTESQDLERYDGINVQALLKINNTWTHEDWSDDSDRIYCRDRKSQRLQELVLIVTNSNFKKTQPNYFFTKAGLNPILQVSPTGCYQWSGTFSMADTSDPGITHTVTGNAVFEADPDIFPPDVFFHLKSGGATLTMTGESSDHINRYNVGASANFSSSDPSSYNYIGTYNLVTGGPHPNAYYGNGQTNATVPGTSWYCCDEEGNWVEEQGNFAIGRWFMTPNPVNNQWISQSSGGVIDGSYTEPNGYITYHWHFVAVTEP